MADAHWWYLRSSIPSILLVRIHPGKRLDLPLQSEGSPSGPTDPAYVDGSGEPVSRSVFRRERTAGQPSEMAGSTRLSGRKPSWVTVNLITSAPRSSRSYAT